METPELESKTLVLLAGGAASRLNSFLKTQDKVKCLVSFDGVTFLDHLLGQAVEAGFSHIIILGGPDSQSIEQAVRKMNYRLRFSFPQEHQRLGTGGALALIGSCILDEYFYLSNADTYFAENPFKIIKNRTTTLRSVNYFMRDNRTDSAWCELVSNECNQWPDLYQTGSYVYTGLSLMKTEVVRNWSSLDLPKVCSYEKDVFAKLKDRATFASYPFREIDFGTETGYRSLQGVFKKKEVV